MTKRLLIAFFCVLLIFLFHSTAYAAPPVAVDDAGVVDEDSTVSKTALTGVLSNDSDPESDPLAVSEVNGNAGDVGVQISLGSSALLTLNADGSYTYDPNGQFESLADGENTTDSFTYTISDGNGGTDTATVTVTINGVNDGPDAVNDAVSTNEDTSFTTANLVAANDTDPDTTDTLSVTGINTAGTTGLVTDNGNGTFDYDPNGQFETLADGESTTDSFTYTISDGNGGTDTATVTVTINGVNDGPDAVNDGVSTNEDTSFTTANLVAANDTDPDTTDTLSVTGINTAGTTGLVTDNGNGTFDYDPNGQFESLADGENTTDSFTYTISDGNGGTDTATVTVTINGVNDGPDAVNDAVSTNEDTSFTTANLVAANDTDPDTTDTLSVTGINAAGTTGQVTDNGNGTFDYDPNGQFDSLASGDVATDSFTYTISDGNGGTDTATVTVTINGADDGPGLDLDANNSGGNSPDFSTTFTENGGPIDITDADATVSDPDSANLVSLTVTITNFNSGDILAADVTGTSVSKNYKTTTGVLKLTGSDTVAHYQTVLNTITYNNTLDNPNPAARIITFVANDGISDGNTVTATVSMVVSNDPPVMTPGGPFILSEHALENDSVGTVAATDADDDEATLIYAIASGNGAGFFQINANTGEITVTAAGEAGLDYETTSSYTLGITAFDGTDTSAIENYTVNISDKNDAPVLTPATPTLTAITEDETTNGGDLVSALIGASVTDADAAAVEGIAVYAVTSSNGTWQVSLNAGTSWSDMGTVSAAQAILLRSIDLIRFVPDGENSDAADFSYYAWDQTSGSRGNKVDVTVRGGATAFSTAADTADIVVSAVNDAPELDNSQAMVLTDVVENTANPPGDTVSAVIATAGGDRITDVDTGAAEGIAVISVDDTNGTWQYDTGGGWTPFGVVSAAAARLLRDTDDIRFVPDPAWTGTADIEFRAWDRTAGAAGGTDDTTSNGGITAYSTDTETATVTVVPDNNAAPVFTGTPVTSPVNGCDANPAGDPVADIIDGVVTDADGDTPGIAVTGVDDANGTWQYDTGGGWLAFGAVSDLSAVLLSESASVRFLPDTPYEGTADITMRAWDQTIGSNGDTGVNVSGNGGATPYSATFKTAVIDVGPCMVINEFMFDPVGADAGNEWIKFYAISSVNINNWTVTDQDGNAYTFPNITMGSGETITLYLSIGADNLAGPEKSVYTGINAEWLDNTGDDILLSDDSGNSIDYVAYGAGADPVPADTTWVNTIDITYFTIGNTLGLDADGNDQNNGNNWIENPMPSPSIDIQKTGAAEMIRGNPVGETYTITVTNNGGAAAYGISIIDDYPDEFSIDSIVSVKRNGAGVTYTATDDTPDPGKMTFSNLPNLLPDDELEIQIRFLADCAATIGIKQNFADAGYHEAPDLSDALQTQGASMDIEVLKGTLKTLLQAIAVNGEDISPTATPEATVGDVITFKTIIQNTNDGDLYDVTSETVWGTGFLYQGNLSCNNVNCSYNAGDGKVEADTASIAGNTQDETYTYTFDLKVDDCAGLTATASADEKCAGQGELTSGVEAQIYNPFIDYTLTPSPLQIPYGTSRTVTIEIENTGDGPADNFTLDTNFEDFTVTITNVSADFLYDNVTGIFTYASEIAAADDPGDMVTLTFNLSAAAGCANRAPAGTIVFDPDFTNQCDEHFYAPRKVYTFSTADVPDVNIQKDINGSAMVDFGDTISFTLTAGVDTPAAIVGNVTVTDVIPAQIINLPTALYPSAGNASLAGNTLTWTINPLNADGATLTVEADIDNDPCLHGTTVTNTASIAATDATLGCPMADSDDATYYINNNPEGSVLQQKTASGPLETCTAAGVTITNNIDIESAVTGQWSGAGTNSLLTEGLHGGDLCFLSGTAEYNFDKDDGAGTDWTGWTAVPGGNISIGGSGELIYDLSFLSAIDQANYDAEDNVAGNQLKVRYNVFLCEDKLGGETATWDTITDFYIEGNAGNCPGDSGLYRQHLLMDLYRSAIGMGINIPGTIEDCGEYVATITVTPATPVNYYDLQVFLDTDHYEYLGNLVTVGFDGAAPVVDTVTFPDQVLFDFDSTGAPDALSSGGTLTFNVRKICGMNPTIQSSATYYSRLDDTATATGCCSANCGGTQRTVNSADTPILANAGNIILEVTPEDFPVATTELTWLMYVTNRGSGTAYNVALTDVLGPNLAYDSSTVNGVGATPTVLNNTPAVNETTVTWDLGDIPVQETRIVEVTVMTTGYSCDINDTNSSIDVDWGCGGTDCQSLAGIALPNFSQPTSEAIVINTFASPFNLCEDGSITLEIKNAGSSHVYNAEIVQDLLASGMVYKVGSAEVSTDGSVWAAANDPSIAGSELSWQGDDNLQPDYVAELADIAEGESAYIRFDLATECDLFGNPQVEAFGTYQKPCQVGSSPRAENTLDAQIRTVPFNKPETTVSVALRNVTQGMVSFINGNVTADQGDTVQYKITLANASNDATVANANLKDVLPANLTFVSITAQDDESGGVQSVVTAGEEWQIEDIGPTDADIYIIEATVASCAPDAVNTAELTYGCTATPEYAACQNFSDTGTHGIYGKLVTRPSLNTDLSVTSSDFTTCGGDITIQISNDGARTGNTIDLINEFIQATLPDGWNYDGSGSGTTIAFDISGTDTTASHTISTEEPTLLAGAHIPQWDTANGNIDYIDTDETLTITYHVKPDGNYCDTDLANDPSPALPVLPTVDTDSQLQDSCGNTYATSESINLSVTYPDIDIAITPVSQLTEENGTVPFTITLTNNGNSTGENLSLVMRLGDGFFNLTETNGGATIVNGTPSTLTWDNTDINAGAGIDAGETWSVDVTADVTSGSLLVQADITGQCLDAAGVLTCTHSYDRDVATVAGISYKKEINQIAEPGSITDAPINQAGTASIGNTVFFDIKTKLLGEGTYAGMTVTDELPAGFEFVAGASPHLAQLDGDTDGTFVDIPTDGSYSAADGGLYARYAIVGTTYTFSIDGDGADPVTFSTGAGNAPREITLRFRARIKDDAANTAGTVLTNVSYTDLSYDNGDGNVYVLDHATQAGLNSNSVITVTEPVLTPTKYYPGWTGDPHHPNLYDALSPKEVAIGELIDYTVAFENADTGNNSAAFDVVITDTVPFGMRIYNPTITEIFIEDDSDEDSGTGTTRTLATPADYTMTFDNVTGLLVITLDNGANGDTANTNTINAGENLVVIYQTQVDSNAGVGIDLENDAYADYSTIRGTPALPESDERDYTTAHVDTTLTTGVMEITKQSTLNNSVVFDNNILTYTLAFPNPVQDVFIYGYEDDVTPGGTPEFTDTISDGLEITGISVTTNPTRTCDLLVGGIYVPPNGGNTASCGDPAHMDDDRKYAVALSTVGAGTRDRTVKIDFKKLYPGDYFVVTIVADVHPTFDDGSAIEDGHVFTNKGSIKVYSKPSSEPARTSNTYTSNQVTAVYNKLINITPDRSGQTTPGSWIAYDHTINNLSGTNEDVCFSIATSKGWTWVIEDSAGNLLLNGATVNPLTVVANGSEMITIRYFVPSDVPQGVVDATDILMHPHNGACLSTTILDSVTDTTVIQTTQLRLNKSVRKCLKTDITNCDAFTDSNAADPCDYLEYRIDFKNLSATPYIGLVISDLIPAHTDFMENAYGAGQDVLVILPDGSTIYKDITPSADAVNVDLSTEIPTLDPGEGGWIQYKIRIKGDGCP